MNLEHFDANPEKVTWKDLNNWYFNLPGGYNRELAEELKKMDLTKRETEQSNLKFYSEKRIMQTNKEFFAEIDDSILKSDLIIEEIKRKNERYPSLIKNIGKIAESTNPETMGLFARLDGMRDSLLQETLPVYRDMRQKGYKHYELIA